MKSATELLAEMLAIYDDPQKSPARLNLWIHQHKKQIREAGEEGLQDTERLDWLERTHHVICYDSGEWFCAWRGADGSGWLDKPMADSPRAAIDRARGEGE